MQTMAPTVVGDSSFDEAFGVSGLSIQALSPRTKRREILLRQSDSPVRQSVKQSGYAIFGLALNYGGRSTNG